MDFSDFSNRSIFFPLPINALRTIVRIFCAFFLRSPAPPASLPCMTAIDHLPARIADKLRSISCTKTLARIRSNRLNRKTQNWDVHIRRHHIFLACIDLRLAIMAARRAASR